MERIVEAMISSTRNFAETDRDNFERALNMSFRRAQAVTETQILLEVAFSETTLQACQCSEMKLLTSIIGIDLPCNHQCSTGAARSPLPRGIGLVLEEDIDTSAQYNLRFIGDEMTQLMNLALNASKARQ
jgi:hypothetical protein